MLYLILLSLVLSLSFGGIFLKCMELLPNMRQPVNEYLPGHAHKKGTVSGGGIVILLSAVPVILMFANSKESTVLVITMVLFALMGFTDDMEKNDQEKKHWRDISHR